MEVKLYQINFDRDKELRMFRSLNTLPTQLGQPFVDSSIYDKVFEGEINGKNPEDVYTVFNTAHPEGYRGRSMSVSDVVEITGEDVVDPGFYFCDTIGFKKIDFDPEQTKSLKETIRVVLCEPGKYARVADIDASLEGLQAAVGGGLIEAVYPFDEPVCIVCNEEGKINGMTLNRSIKDNGKILDIIAGPFFICGCSTDRFSSLTEKQQKTYLRQFRYPEQFARINGEIHAMGYKPDRNSER